MNIGLIVAAGRGHRLGGPVPKQYRDLCGMPILRRSIMALLAHQDIHAVQAVIHPDDMGYYEPAVAGLEKLRPVLFGGAARQDSVRLGLEGIASLNPAKVLIHDAVRPFVTSQTIADVLAALDHTPCAIAGMALADTLKRCENGFVIATIERANLFRAQTPQGFRYAEILAAHRQLAASHQAIEFTDDSMIAEHAGLPVQLIPGSESCFKITTEADLHRAETLLA